MERELPLKRPFSATHRQKLALARLAKSERQREIILAIVAADPHASDADICRRMGLKPRMIRKHLKVLREDGMIAVKIERHEGFQGWMNYRTIALIAKGQDATIFKGQVG